MKTTLNIDDRVMAQLRKEATERGTTLSKLVEAALRLFLRKVEAPRDLPELPIHKSGGLLVDVANREALYRAMEDG